MNVASQNKLNIALCGSGRIGRVHAANIAAHPGLNLAWVADPMVDSAREVATLYGARATGSTDDVFADASLDAVLICSPTPTHVDLIRAAVGRGIAVLCEKPIDLDIDRVRSCLADLAGNTAAVMMGFNRRFDPAFAAVRKRVAAGEIGRLEQLTIISRDPAPAPAAYIAASGGIFRDMSIHDLDMARFFIPDIVEVTAHGANVFSDYIAEAGDFDSAVITLRGRNGELVSITNSRHSAYGYDQRLEAFGSQGMLRADNISPTTVRSFGRACRGGGRPVRAVLPGALRRSLPARAGPLRRRRPHRQPLLPWVRGRHGRTHPCRRRSRVGRNR